MSDTALTLPMIVDEDTGEVFAAHKVKPAQLRNIIAKLPDETLSGMLTEFNYIGKLARKIETGIKNYIKEEKGLKFNEETDMAKFVDWALVRYPQRRFNEKRLMAEGTEEEKEVYKKIKEKYTDTNTITKFK